MIRAAFSLSSCSSPLSALCPARASGPFLPALRFYSYSGVDADSDTAYFKGRLGIIRPTFGENRLYAAYRILLGQAFTDDQARQLLASCCDIRSPAEADKMQNGWLDIRASVTAEKPKPDLNPYRPTKNYIDFLNCYPSAFDTAATTLKARIAAFGAKDRWVIEWVKGQDAVFANCSQTDLTLPAADLPDAPDWLKADRAYQLAGLISITWTMPKRGRALPPSPRILLRHGPGSRLICMARASLPPREHAKSQDAITQAQQDIAALQAGDKSRHQCELI